MTADAPAGQVAEPETRIVVCEACNGDGGWEVPHGIDYVLGGLLVHERKCTNCGGRGEEEIEVEPITEGDCWP